MNVPSAVNALQNNPVFRNTSARHLTDLVHLALPGAVRVARGAQRDVGGVFLVVAEGRVRLDEQRLVLPAGTVALGVDAAFFTNIFEISFVLDSLPTERGLTVAGDST